MTDRAKRLAAIGETIDALEWHWADDPDPSKDPGIGAHTALRDVEAMATTAIPFLLREVRNADTALAALGVPDDGRSLADRIKALGAELTYLRGLPRSEPLPDDPERLKAMIRWLDVEIIGAMDDLAKERAKRA